MVLNRNSPIRQSPRQPTLSKPRARPVAATYGALDTTHMKTTTTGYQPKTGQPCNCKVGQQRDNCPQCEGTGERIDFAAIRAKAPATRIDYPLHEKTSEAVAKVPRGTVNRQAQNRGLLHGEALLVAMDGLLRYAIAYERRFDSKLAEDGVLADHWLYSLKGIRGLLNGDGCEAMWFGWSTDSKDNGALEDIFWAALEAAGYTEETANL